MMVYYTELQQKEHSFTEEIGAIRFYRIVREHGLPWPRQNSAVFIGLKLKTM